MLAVFNCAISWNRPRFGKAGEIRKTAWSWTGRKAVWVINVTYKTIAPVRVTKKLSRLETTEQGHVIFRPCQPEIKTGPNHFKVDESPG